MGHSYLCCIQLHNLLFLFSVSVYWMLNVYLRHWEPPYQDIYCLFSSNGGGGCSFFFGASFIPYPARPQCPLFPKATAMEICFRHTANYLRVITSLPVQGDNEWLIGHSLLCRCVLLLPLSVIATCLTGGDGWCCPFGQPPPTPLAFLEVTWNINSGFKAGSEIMGTWSLFGTVRIPQACKCWWLEMCGNAGSVLVVLTVNDFALKWT